MKINEIVDLNKFKLEKENGDVSHVRKNERKKEEILRGDIFYADLTNAKELGKSVQAGIRPVIIIQNNIGNKYSPNVNVVPISSQVHKLLPPHLQLQLQCLDMDSIVLNENIMTIGKELLKQKVGHCTDDIMLQINNKLNKQINTIPELDMYELGKLVKSIKRLTKKLKHFETEEFKELLDILYNQLNYISILYQIPVGKMMNMFDKEGQCLVQKKQHN